MVRRSQSPDCPPSGRAVGPSPLLPWARLCGCGVRRCPLGLHALGGPRSAGVVGASGARRCPSPGRPPPGRAVGVHHPHAVGAGVRVLGPGPIPSACMPGGSCVPRGWWGAAPGGVGLPALRGVSGVRRCPSPSCPPSGAVSLGSATRVSRVRSVRAWGPSTGPTACALAGRRCSPWGWQKGIPGGVPSSVARGVRCQVLALPRLSAHWAGCWGPLPTCCGRRRVVVGAQRCPLGLHALWGLRAAGVAGGRPRGGWPATAVRGVWWRCPSPDRPPTGRAAGVL